MKDFKMHLSVECTGVIELKAKSEQDAFSRIQEAIRAGEINVRALRPMNYSAAVDGDILKFIKLQ